MSELENILSFIYDIRNSENIVIKLKLDTTNECYKTISINLLDNVTNFDKYELNKSDILYSIDFIETLKLIRFHNHGRSSIMYSNYIDDIDLYDKWFPIFKDYCYKETSKFFTKSFGNVLSTNLTQLYRDYKLNKIIQK